MLPLMQMHPMVPTPPHFEHLVPVSNHIKPEYLALCQQPRQPRPSNPYANPNVGSRPFPIRSSQPAQPSQQQQQQQPQQQQSSYRAPGASSFAQSHLQVQPDHSQHQLRRKTPNGTIDAGYDGSPAGLAIGPPQKQLIIPASPKIFPTAFGHTNPQLADAFSGQLHLSNNIWQYPHTAQQIGGGYEAQPAGWNLGQSLQPDGAPLPDRIMAPQQPPSNLLSNDLRLQGVFTPSYQHNMGPTAFNPAGFTPPPVWKDPGVSDFRGQAPMSNLGFIPQNAAFDAAYIPSQNSMHHPLQIGQQMLGGPLQGRVMHTPMPGFDADNGVLRPPQTAIQLPRGGLESLSLRGSATASPVGSLASRSDPSAPAQFKERVLAQAHKAYGELLLYISYTKQSLPGKAMSGLRTLSKMVVFPKPPKQLGLSLSPPRHPAAMHARPGSFAGAESAFGASTSQVKYAYAGRTYRAGGGNPTELPSPVSSARHSLEVLTNLCEQSGWRWVDGMLLGGCLHYGLEHYEEALDWFKRITNLDSSHVEAISNIAATLYCLNRHDEAERYWVEAVTLRPGYLEAVEHLVGLLCSTQRSRQAVDIISRVQRSLRTPEREPPQGDAASQALPLPSPSAEASNQPGFGSSGYMIPGNENGRMILLIHAKGNMLYALKDIERASEAFEEVVMISTGRQSRGIQSLIREIQTVLSPRPSQPSMPSAAGAVVRRPVSGPLLLPPDRAKLTAQFVFGPGNAQLPGLRFVGEGSHRKSAVSTTSNSLLSLAKIFQDSMSTGGAPPCPGRQASGVGEILALYYLSLSLQESPSTANNVGILLASVQQSAAQVEPLSPESAALVQHIPGIVRGSGLELALLYYQYGLTLDPHHVHLHTNLGSLLKDIGQLDLAIQMYERAVACDGTFDIALTNLANAVKDRGRISDAIMYYKRAVTSNPDFAEAVCGLSTALNSVCDWRGRGGVYLYGAKFDRWHVDELGMLQDVRNSGQGSGLTKRVVGIVGRQLQESASWGVGTLVETAIALLVSQLTNSGGAELTNASTDLEAELRKWADQPWEGSRIIRLIERATRAAMRRWYLDKHVKGQEAAGGYPRPRLPGSLTIPSAPTVLPFHTFTCPLTAKDIRMISQRNAHRISCSTLRAPWVSGSVYPPPPPPRPHLNVGYLSSDFNNHPLAHLMQSVFGFHDQARVKAFCYATTASDKSIHRRQIEREAPVFRDVSNWPSDKLVDQIVQDGIHILVNLNGYTRGARNEIFAARPAPIQMSFMGFAGTLGAEWCDYLLADATAVPPSTLRPWRGNLGVEDVFKDEAEVDNGEWVYSENIIYCRDTFFCCDHAQSADVEDERNMSWEEEERRRWKMRKELFPNLPDDTIILGNFNQLYKIDPTTFRAWLRILSAVPKAILWLLRFPDLGEINLKRTAREWAGEHVANRILFTDVAPKQQHISRARVCDLFLDTPECNAHTTAADILWSSTPLLTLPRYEYKMCSRMAASILKGALPKSEEGLRAASELVAEDDVEYENLAVKLANGLSYQLNKAGGYGEGSGRLAELRRLLWESKWTCALFDTRRWVRDLEDAYDEAWRRWVAGEGGDIHL